MLRFSELERDEVPQKMLAQHLRELERDGLVYRTDHAEIPPRVDYRLTERDSRCMMCSRLCGQSVSAI